MRKHGPTDTVTYAYRANNRSFPNLNAKRTHTVLQKGDKMLKKGTAFSKRDTTSMYLESAHTSRTLK